MSDVELRFALATRNKITETGLQSITFSLSPISSRSPYPNSEGALNAEREITRRSNKVRETSVG